jgi:acylphosphatase
VDGTGRTSGPQDTRDTQDTRDRLQAQVQGRVQGVGFRFFVQDRAGSLGLTGYVRNAPDGRRVEVVAEGPRDALRHLLEALQQGPPGAYVERVVPAWGPASGEFSAFTIRH